MAECTNFEDSIREGIRCDEAVMSQPYIPNLKTGIEDSINRMKMDNFYANDSGTITKSKEDLETLDKAVQDTGILYEMYPEKKELMARILQEIEDLKQTKTNMDSSIIARDCDTYNDNLEAAKEGYMNVLLKKGCQEYNNNPCPLEYTFRKIPQAKVNGPLETTTQYAYVSDGVLHKRSGSVYAPHGYQFVEAKTKYDKISEDQANHQGNNMIASMTETIKQANKFMAKQLNGRGLRTPRSETRPDHTYYYG